MKIPYIPHAFQKYSFIWVVTEEFVLLLTNKCSIYLFSKDRMFMKKDLFYQQGFVSARVPVFSLLMAGPSGDYSLLNRKICS